MRSLRVLIKKPSVFLGEQIIPVVTNTVLEGNRLNTSSWICSSSQTITKQN